MMTRDELLIAVSIATEYGRSAITVEQAAEKLKAHDAEQRQVIEQQAKQIADLTAQANSFHRHAAEWRGIDFTNVCQRCDGSGLCAYANTSTYHHGIGGQMIVTAVCDKCWGSGDSTNPWKSWLMLEGQAQEIERYTSELCAQRELIAHFEEREVDYLETIQKCEDAIRTLREALARLVNETSGVIGIAERQMREAIGNTNLACLATRVNDAQRVLEETKP